MSQNIILVNGLVLNLCHVHEWQGGISKNEKGDKKGLTGGAVPFIQNVLSAEHRTYSGKDNWEILKFKFTDFGEK